MVGVGTGRVRSRAHRIGTSVAATLLAVMAGAMAGALPGLSQAGASQKATAASPSLGKVQMAPRIPTGTSNMGAVSTSSTVTGAVVLEPRDPAAVTKFIAAVTDRSSPTFHKYLAPGAYAARFGPTSSTLSAVEKQLKTDGLSITNVASDHLVLSFSATASKVESTFHTGLDRYKLSDGSTGLDTTTAVKLPSSIASSVVSVVGLDDLFKEQPADEVVPKATRAAQTAQHPAASAPKVTHVAGAADECTTASTIAKTYGGLTDTQIANAYGAFGLYQEGDFAATQTIAVYELGAFTRTDVGVFDQCYFGTKATRMMTRLHTETNDSTLKIDGGEPAGLTGESSLDVEDVSAIAPTANIDVYQAPNNTFGGLDEYSAIVNDDTAKIVTSSWGFCEQAIQLGEPGVQQAENVLFEQAAAQGQSVFAAAGDTGSDDCNAYRFTTPVSPDLSVDDPGSQPYVVSVGGTTITDATQPPSEHVWNDGAVWGAGGGGISQSWSMPSWQLDSHVQGVDTPTVVGEAETFEQADLTTGTYAFCLSTSVAGQTHGTATGACREVPDVSAQADEFTGAITIYGTTAVGTVWTTIGGTSSATPIWAAMIALVNTSNTSGVGSTCSNGTGVGFVSPLLYTVASTSTAYAASFTDITTGNDDPYGDSGLFPAGTGYDMASGLGSPELTNTTTGVTTDGLAYYLCQSVTGPSSTRPVVSSITPAVVPTAASGATVLIHGSGFSTVTSVTIGTVPATVTHSTATTVTVTAPTGAELAPPGDTTDGAGAYNVIVTLKSGASSAPSAASTIEYVDETSGVTVPAVTSVRTFAGSEAGGNTVQIFGTGFTSATAAVTFGSVPANTFTVTSPSEITVTNAPAFTTGTTDCAQTGATFKESATTDICQVTVVVKDASGSSAPTKGTTTPALACVGPTGTGVSINPFYEGLYDTAINLLGVIPQTATYEQAPLPCEYDYVPTPTITSVSTTGDTAASLASEGGGSVVTVTGSGFNLAGLERVTVGTPTQASSIDYTLVSVSGTEIQFDAPAETATLGKIGVPFAVTTVAGSTSSSTPATVTYAGVPATPSSVTATTTGKHAAPATTVTTIQITGAGGYTDADLVGFIDFSEFTLGTQYTLSITSPDQIKTKTTPVNPGIADVEVCSVTACSTPSTATTQVTDVLALYAPGNPVVTSVTPDTGPAKGGTTVTISGQNLGCATSVTFGTTPATTFENPASFLDCGQTTAVTVVVPAHAAGTVTVHVSTIESLATGTTTTSTATYTYTAASHGGGGGGTSPPSTGNTTPPITTSGTTPPTSGTRIAGKVADGTAVDELEKEFPATGATGSCVGSAANSANTRPVILATTAMFPDSLSASYLASSLDTGILLTPKSTLSATTKAALEKEGVTKVILVGGTLAVSATVADAVAATPADSCGGSSATGQDIVVTRIGGKTATDTAEMIAESVPKSDVGTASFTGAYAGTNATGGTGAYNDTAGAGSAAPSTAAPLRTAVLADANEYQDAMAASAMAYAMKFPVLLTTPTSLSAQAASAIADLTISQVVVMGGQLVISNSVVSSLESLGVSVLRIGGKVDTDTAVQLAKFEVAGGGAGLGWSGTVRAAVTRGDGFTDGLAGSVVTGTSRVPLLLTQDPSTLGSYLTAFLKGAGQSGTGIDGMATSKLGALTIFGGSLAVTTAAVSQMENDIS